MSEAILRAFDRAPKPSVPPPTTWVLVSGFNLTAPGGALPRFVSTPEPHLPSVVALGEGIREPYFEEEFGLYRARFRKLDARSLGAAVLDEVERLRRLRQSGGPSHEQANRCG